jgi:hypothetical protein
MIEFRADGLALKIAAYSPAGSEDWPTVLVKSSSNGFQGEFIAWLQTEDLTRFATELSRMVTDLGQELTATLASAEPDLNIELKLDRHGRIKGRYRFESERRDAGIPTVLSGQFEMDQTYIPLLLMQVHELTKRLRG